MARVESRAHPRRWQAASVVWPRDAAVAVGAGAGSVRVSGEAEGLHRRPTGHLGAIRGATAHTRAASVLLRRTWPNRPSRRS